MAPAGAVDEAGDRAAEPALDLGAQRRLAIAAPGGRAEGQDDQLRVEEAQRVLDRRERVSRADVAVGRYAGVAQRSDARSLHGLGALPRSIGVRHPVAQPIARDRGRDDEDRGIAADGGRQHRAIDRLGRDDEDVRASFRPAPVVARTVRDRAAVRGRPDIAAAAGETDDGLGAAGGGGQHERDERGDPPVAVGLDRGDARHDRHDGGGGRDEQPRRGVTVAVGRRGGTGAGHADHADLPGPERQSGSAIGRYVAAGAGAAALAGRGVRASPRPANGGGCSACDGSGGVSR